LPELCKTIHDKTGTLCTIRLTVNDLLSQRVYEGGVDVLNEDGTSCTFDSADGVAWLQMYVDMVTDGTVDRTVLVTDQDRVGLDAFIGGNSAFYQTGPNLIREVRSNNPGLYGYLAAVPAPVGKSGVLGKGLMGISVKNDTEFPNASIALAQFFTNPQSMLEFSKVVAIYPSTPLSYDDPFFAAEPIAIEDSAKPIAKDIVATYADIVPSIPNKAEVNEAVLQAVQSALFDNVPAQEALSAAVEQCNALITQ
jgi:ABC-type glycerol-3-phosphate transport system substrate-binding protein